jgi:hypothetical protein
MFLMIAAVLEAWVFTVLTVGTGATLFQTDILAPILGLINAVVGSIRVTVPI